MNLIMSILPWMISISDGPVVIAIICGRKIIKYGLAQKINCNDSNNKREDVEQIGDDQLNSNVE